MYKLNKPYTKQERIQFVFDYQLLNIQETDLALYALEPWEKLVDDEVIDNTEQYNKEQAQKRQQEFLKDFFKVPLSSQFTEKEYAYYRKIPKGYTSAIESINTAERICSKMQGLPANNLIFYEEPDFYDETQCTEEWLSSHQIIIPALTVEQFDNIFITFIQSWNTQEHSKANEQENEKGEENEYI